MERLLNYYELCETSPPLVSSELFEEIGQPEFAVNPKKFKEYMRFSKYVQYEPTGLGARAIAIKSTITGAADEIDEIEKR